MQNYFQLFYYFTAILYSFQGFYVSYNYGYTLDYWYILLRNFVGVVQVLLHLFYFLPYRMTKENNKFSFLIVNPYFRYLIYICNWYLFYYLYLMTENYILYDIESELVGIFLLMYTLIYRVFVPIKKLDYK